MTKTHITLTISHKGAIIALSYMRGLFMYGINLNGNIAIRHASMRYFDRGERHVNRFCRENVLLMVFDGILRFSEDGRDVEVGAGRYYIQRKNTYQEGKVPSDKPKYLYVHFDADITDTEGSLPLSGDFDTERLMGIMTMLDEASHNDSAYIEREYLFLKLLLSLRTKRTLSEPLTKAQDYIRKNIKTVSSLDELCQELHYSKNYVIRIFKKELGKTPFQYINTERISLAKYLLETTSRSLSEIATECGFSDYPYFYKCFLKEECTSPSEWRKRIQTTAGV